jgi:methyltransferase (TIGR00027 family)
MASGTNEHHRIEPTISWEEDYRTRVSPTLMTQLLQDAIPALKAVQWRVTEVREGACTSELPLCRAATNQHGTHQGALISLSADYTGGLALATLLRGVPLAGVHPCTSDRSASIWLASMEVRFRSPSTGHLTASCEVPPHLQRMVRNRYFAGKRVLVKLPVLFRSNDEIVAEAQMKYLCQPSIQLEPTVGDQYRSPLLRHKLKASARMIAGLRADGRRGMLRIDSPHERQAAGPHGELLAARLGGILPQLRDMVLARTRHGDETLRSIPGWRQVVLLGVGLDMRPFRLYRQLGEPLFFELDLPEMLEERSRVISQMNARPPAARRMVAADFKRDRVAELLLKHPDFDPRVPTCVIYEGCSMYFSAAENEAVLGPLAATLQHPDSRLWSDWVTRGVVTGPPPQASIGAFLRGMEELGERFIFGVDDPAEFLRPEYTRTRVESVADYLGGDDPVLQTYQFAVSAP